MGIRRTALATVILAGMAMPLVTAQPADASRASTATCSASVSNAHPLQNSTVKVSVSKVGAGAAVTTVAHYKTTNTTKKTTADQHGHASTSYKIGRATRGYKVVVNVSASKGSAHWSCQTSIITR